MPRLDLSIDGAVATVTITNPAKRNAMTVGMWRALPSLLDRLAADAAVRVVVLTGAGDHFCAGADLADLTELRDNGGGSLTTVAEGHLAAFPKPTIARISGYCVGGGCQLAVACDLRFAGEGSQFGVTPAKLGVVYPAVTTRRLVRLVGPGAAKYLLFSGKLITVERAASIGLVDEIATSHDVQIFAQSLTRNSRLTIAAAKDIIDAEDDSRVAYWRSQAQQSSDLDEGIAAFRERRAPTFSWRP